MKVCTKTHKHRGFGEVPAGSLWDDDDKVVAAHPEKFEDADPKQKKGDD